MAERNPLVLTDLGGGAGKLEELPAGDTLPDAATVATLSDAAASSDLPPTGASATLSALMQAVRNTLKWLLTRFNASGQLSLAYGGTGNGLGTATGITFFDTRATAEAPAQIETKRISAAFKQTATVGNPPVTSTQALYSHIVRVAAWDEGGSGGWPTELSLGPGGIAFRYGTAASTWSAWSQLQRKGNAVDIPDGTIAAPGISFTAEPGTGFRRSAANTVRYVAGSSDICEMSLNAITMLNNRVLAAIGSGTSELSAAAGVSYSPASATGSWARGLVVRGVDNAIMLAGAGFLGTGETLTRWAVGFNNSWWSTYAFAVGSADAQFSVPTRWLNGTAAAPSVSWVNSTTSGLYWAQGVGMGFSVSGTQKLLMGSASVLFGESSQSFTPQVGLQPAVQVRGASVATASIGVTNSANDATGAALFLGSDRANGSVAVGDVLSAIYHTAHNGTSHVSTGLDRLIATAVVAGGAVTVRRESILNGVTVETGTSASKALGVPLRMASYTLSTLPSAAALDGHLIEVSNATGGAKVCRSNGTAWQLLNTATTVS